MSKGEKKHNSSWEYVEGRCEYMFGDRFSVDDQSCTLSIEFNLADHIQLHEHHAILRQLDALKIPYVCEAPHEEIQGSPIVLSQGNRVILILDKAAITSDQLNDSCLVPLLSYSQFPNEARRRYNEQSAITQYLNGVTDIPWVGVVPSPYSREVVFQPAQQTPNLSQEQRREQELAVIDAFVPSDKNAHNVDNWIDNQRAVESANGLPITTALHHELLPTRGRQYRGHQYDIANERKKSFIERARAAFKPER